MPFAEAYFGYNLNEILILKVSKEAEYSVKPNDISKREQLVDGLGTHYVRKISYGGQMVASIKLSFPPNSLRYVKKIFLYSELDK